MLFYWDTHVLHLRFVLETLGLLLTMQETGPRQDPAGGVRWGLRPRHAPASRSTETPVCTAAEKHRFGAEDLSATYIYIHSIFYSFSLRKDSRVHKLHTHPPWRGRGVFKLIRKAAVFKALLGGSSCREKAAAGERGRGPRSAVGRHACGSRTRVRRGGRFGVPQSKSRLS